MAEGIIDDLVWKLASNLVPIWLITRTIMCICYNLLYHLVSLFGHASFKVVRTITYLSKQSVHPLPAFARLFLGNCKPLNKIFSLCVLLYLINIDRALKLLLAICKLSRN